MAAQTVVLTASQRLAVRHTGHLSLISCPGSGKTRVIVAKMLACAEAVAGTPRRVGCITYTNAAVSEIQERLLLQASNDEAAACEISTIHGFCLNQIIRPFSSRISDLRLGFEVIAPDSEKFRDATTVVMREHGLDAWLEDSFPSIQRRLDDTLFIPRGLSEDAARAFVNLVSQPGLLTFADIIYHAAKLATTDAEIARALACKFAWLLVDEFQDTTDLQASMLLSLAAQGRTKLFMVGDPHQAIFSFAGARPELMADVAMQIKARTDIVLSGTHRCSNQIVTVAETLLPRTPPMSSVAPSKDHPAQPRHHHAASPLVGVLGSFLPELKRHGIELGNAAILAPQWPILYNLARGLREKGVPVIGPGARPYRRSLDFAQFAEASCAYIDAPDSGSAALAQRSLFQMLLLLTGEPVWDVFSYEGKKVLVRALSAAKHQRQATRSAIQWLRNMSATVDQLLTQAAWLPLEHQGKLQISAATMIDAIRRNVRDPDALTVEELAIFARPEKCIHLLTMHSAKGREFDAVALVGFQEGLIPHFTNRTPLELGEAKRLAYVAMTRPRKVLIVITDDSNQRNPNPSRFVAMAGL